MLSPIADLLEADEHADAVVHVDDRDRRPSDRAGPTGTPSRRPAAARVRDAPPRRRRLRRRSAAPASGSRNPRDRPPTAIEHRRVTRILCTFDRNGEHLVLFQQLDCSLGAARSRGNEQRGFAVVAAAADLGHPVSDAAAHFNGRLAAHVRTCAGAPLSAATRRGIDELRRAGRVRQR